MNGVFQSLGVAVAALAPLFSACGPVLLESVDELDAGATPAQAVDPTQPASPPAPSIATAASDAGPAPSVALNVKPVDCGECFELRAVAVGGREPYVFEWADGLIAAERRVCVSSSDVTFAVVARDATGARSETQTVRLQALAQTGCDKPLQPSVSTPAPLLCLQNPSFEGPPTANFGQPDSLDAAPWSPCVDASMTRDLANTPSIGNQTNALTSAPAPTDGTTYLALGAGQQVSQMACAAIAPNTSVSVTLDLATIDLSGGLVPASEPVFLEVWGGSASDCSQHELLWASPALTGSWRRYCATLHPHSLIDQITLRAHADMSVPSASYLLVDNLKSVDNCQ
jgi:hypothetical protein